MKKVSRRDLIILALVLTAFWMLDVPRLVFQTKSAKEQAEKAGGIYYCPMHPTYVSDKPGDCPICYMKLVPKPGTEGKKKEHRILYYRHPMGQPDISPVPKKDAMGMDYIPVYEDEFAAPSSGVPGYAAVQIPGSKQQLMGVTLGTVEKRWLTKEIRTVGRVVFDPELFTAQQEYVSALEGARRRKDVPYHEPVERAEALVESAKVRLQLLGMSEEEIHELEKEGATQDRALILPEISQKPQEVVTNPTRTEGELVILSEVEGSSDADPERMARDGSIGRPPAAWSSRPSTRPSASLRMTDGQSPLSASASSPGNDGQFVWVYATIYEYELPFVKVGTKVRVRVPTFPDREFSGEVRALNPVLDAATRSIRVRARVENRDGLLRPQMYLDVTLETDLGEKLAIPEEAVMPTGERHLVFVAQPNGYFQPRNIKLGAKAGQFYEVAEGLEAGERVATSGNFLIDSESRLQGALESVTTKGES